MSLTVVDYLVKNNEDWVDSLFLSAGDGDVAEDLTGSQFFAQFRTTPQSLFVVLDANTTNDRIVIADPPTSGEISWNVAAAVLKNITPGVYVYDIVHRKLSGAEDTFATGTLTIERGITRP